MIDLFTRISFKQRLNYNLYCISIITMLRTVHNIVLTVKGVSPRQIYVRTGYTRYDKPKNINLADHTDPFELFTKYVQA